MGEDDNHKDVYAHFGLAIFRAQLLEHGIVNALVVCDLIPNRRHQAKSREEWSAQVDQFMDGHFEKTAGTLMKALRKAITVSDELEQSLSRSLKLRNFLVHHFFRERVASWYTEQGRGDMIAALESAGDQFGESDQLIGAAVQPLKDRYGLTQEQEDQLLVELRADAILGKPIC